MGSYADRHFVVPRLRRRDVGPRRRQHRDQALGIPALARAGTAEDEGQYGGHPNRSVVRPSLPTPALTARSYFPHAPEGEPQSTDYSGVRAPLTKTRRRPLSAAIDGLSLRERRGNAVRNEGS